MTTQTLDDLLDEFQTCAYQSCFSLCDELRVKIKEALMSQSGGAQPEHEKYCPICQGVGQVDTGIMESPVTICNACNGTGLKAQPEQEPVAWAHKGCLESIKDFDATIYANGGFDDAVALYTTPPQRKPLTDEQYEAIIEDLAEWSRYVEVDTAHQSLEKHVRQVLAAHGIKE